MFNSNVNIIINKKKRQFWINNLNKTKKKKKDIKRFLFQIINISLKRKLIIISNLLGMHIATNL